jgi:hypothetical protein
MLPPQSGFAGAAAPTLQQTAQASLTAPQQAALTQQAARCVAAAAPGASDVDPTATASVDAFNLSRVLLTKSQLVEAVKIERALMGGCPAGFLQFFVGASRT